jgi:hypothetical protein
MEPSFLDLGLGCDWGLLVAPDASLGIDDLGVGHVLSGVSPRNQWSYKLDPCGPSPVDETLQDSIWLDHADVDISKQETFGGLVLQEQTRGRSISHHRKLSSGSWCDEAVPPQSLFVSDHSPDHSFSAPDVSVGKFSIDSSSNSSSIISNSPIDVRFEFGDIYNSQPDDNITDRALLVMDYVDNQGFTSISSQPVQSVRPLLSLGSYESEQIPAAYSPDYVVPDSPILADESFPILKEESVSPFDDLECDEHDTLHDEESVCRLLLALDGSAHLGARFLDCVGSMLSHVSPEEVESVLSRDSSCDNLLAHDTDSFWDDSASLKIDSVAGLLVGSDMSGTDCSGINAMRTSIASPFTVIDASSLATSSSANSFAATGSLANSLSVINSEYQRAQVTSKLTPLPPRSRISTPCHIGEVLSERRVRKKEQNKTAALRYRQKKREEKGHTMTEVEELEQKNSELRNRAEELTKEIGYLRGLLEEITKV